ncbi:MAG TPA: hypothetical protein VLF68_04320 [Candidatus Saccharimonadales bacterium]|nr:hypothetical protein [Candidatus Saccharimonadales bacterium]
MKYSFLKNKYLPYSLLILGIVWVILNIYFLPFHIWDAGVVRPWYMLKGLVIYKDFTWIRMPFDIFTLAVWYKFVGVSAAAYQNFIFLIETILTIAFFFISRKIQPKVYLVSFLTFIIFLFPLFQNTEIGELLIGLIQLLLFFCMYLFITKKKLRYLIFAAGLTGISFITKQNSILVAGAFLTVLLLQSLKTKRVAKDFLQKAFIYLGIAILPFLALIFYFSYLHALKDFLYYTVLFLFTTYKEANVVHGDGGWIAAAYVVVLIPFIFLRKSKNLKPVILIFLVLQIASLFPSFFPSFLSYRAFTMFPLVCLAAGFSFSILFEKSKINKKAAVIISYTLLLFFISRFISGYITAFNDGGGFAKGQLLTSYGTTEQKVADEIKKNSSSNDRILNYGSEMMYLEANRLPANKYVDPFPYLLKPYNNSEKVFAAHPPKLVVYDTSLPGDHAGLSQWPFLQMLQDKYDVMGRFDKNLVLYRFRSSD